MFDVPTSNYRNNYTKISSKCKYKYFTINPTYYIRTQIIRNFPEDSKDVDFPNVWTNV